MSRHPSLGVMLIDPVLLGKLISWRWRLRTLSCLAAVKFDTCKYPSHEFTSPLPPADHFYQEHFVSIFYQSKIWTHCWKLYLIRWLYVIVDCVILTLGMSSTCSWQAYSICEMKKAKIVIVQLEAIQSPVFIVESEFPFRSEKKLINENVMKIKNKYLESVLVHAMCMSHLHLYSWITARLWARAKLPL